MIEIISQKKQLSIEKAIFAISSGDLICFPTETVYALACDIFDLKATIKIYNLKKRQQNKPLSILCATIEQIKQFAEIDIQVIKLINKFSPGPLTYVLKIKKQYQEQLSHFTQDNTIGVRIPNHSFALKLLSNLPNPLIATSVNPAGQTSSTNIKQIINYFGKSDILNLIIDGGNAIIGIPSTVVKIDEGNIQILREGAISLTQINEVLANS